MTNTNLQPKSNYRSQVGIKGENANMNKSKKGSRVINILIALSVIVIIVLAFTYFRLYSENFLTHGFNPDRVTEASQLYNEIISFNFITDYPETPEEVMELYLKTVRLLYGDMLRNEDYIFNVIEVQRRFLSDEILRRNRIDDQFRIFQMKLEELAEMDVVTISLEQRAPVFPTPERDICTIRVTQFNSGARNTHLVYTLSSDNPAGRWRIIYWEVTDANFNPLREQ